MKRIQRTLASLCLLPLAACNCESSPIDRLEPVLEHEPGLLDLGELPLGVRGQGAVTVRSRGSAMLTLTAVRLEGDPLFKLANEIMRNLPPSTSDVVLVEARPSELGERLGTLILESDDPLRTLVRITVRVVGVPQPPCDDNNPCTADAFDPELDDCVHSFQDGVACQPADHCIVGAVCSQGVCLGATKTCDDQSACTRDFCRQTTGECVFLAEPMACDDANPCTADSCQGDACAHEPVANGIACEDGDSCTTGDACFAGACRGSGRPEGSACDDLDSCTVDDTCTQGQCRGRSILTGVAEGEEVFRYPLTTWDDAFLHRREVSLSDDGVYFGLDHLPATNPPGLIHEIFAMHQCGTPLYVFDYRPPDSHVLVRFVRREMQLERDRSIRVVVGVRQLPDDGYRPETTTYVLDPDGRVQFSSIQALGGETGRALLPDGSHIYGTIFPLSFGPPTPEDPARQNLIIVREDRFGNVLWRHERDSGDWSEFLGVAGPRVLFWARGNFGALDFNTGDQVWSFETRIITKEISLSTALNLGVARASTQLVGVDILNGRQIFTFPPQEDFNYLPRTDPVISADGRVLVLMQRSTDNGAGAVPTSLEWVELSAQGEVLNATPLSDYVFPEDFSTTRHEDDPYPTVADDGVSYLGYGTHFWAIDPGGRVRWTITSSVPNAFTGVAPLLREDGVVLLNEGHRLIRGVRSNGGRMSQQGWAAFRHDGRRTNFTP